MGRYSEEVAGLNRAVSWGKYTGGWMAENPESQAGSRAEAAERFETSTKDGAVVLLGDGGLDIGGSGTRDFVEADGIPSVPNMAEALGYYLASLSSEGSRRVMGSALERVARFLSADVLGAQELPWHLLRYRHVAALRAELAGRYAPATANRMLSAVRGVVKQSYLLGMMDGDEYQRILSVGAVSGERLPPGRSLERDELVDLLVACTRDRRKVRGARDAALVATLYGCGLRRAEAVGLRRADYRQKTGALLVRGKGNKERLVYVPPGGLTAMEAWLTVRGPDAGPLFCRVLKNGRLVLDRPLSSQAVLYILGERREEAGLAPLTPHDLRRTFISDVLDATQDLSGAQQAAGHADPRTTARYDRRGERVKQKVAAAVDVPYKQAEDLGEGG
jgi:site-specific recombinase XerD